MWNNVPKAWTTLAETNSGAAAFFAAVGFLACWGLDVARRGIVVSPDAKRFLRWTAKILLAGAAVFFYMQGDLAARSRGGVPTDTQETLHVSPTFAWPLFWMAAAGVVTWCAADVFDMIAGVFAVEDTEATWAARVAAGRADDEDDEDDEDEEEDEESDESLLKADDQAAKAAKAEPGS